MRVFEGGDGSTSGGRSERSRDSGDLLRDDARERCGDGTATCMFAVVSVCKSMLSVDRLCKLLKLVKSKETDVVLYQVRRNIARQLPQESELWGSAFMSARQGRFLRLAQRVHASPRLSRTLATSALCTAFSLTT